MIGRQIEFTGATGNDGAAAYAHQPFILADVLTGFALQANQRTAGALDVGKHLIKPGGFDIGIGFEAQQSLLLSF